MHITHLVQVAKDHLLEAENIRPMIWVEWDMGKLDMMVLESLPETTLEKEKMFFLLGRQIGANPDVHMREITQVCFVVEAWTSTNTTYCAPSDDPDRKEVLIALILTIQPTPDGRQITHALRRIEIVRDRETNKVLDLLPEGKGTIEVKSNLLIAFLAGFQSTKLLPSELIGILRRQ